MNLINEIKKKKEFSEIPDSIVKKILQMKKVRGLEGKSKVKEARAILRKLFSAFLTKKMLTGKIKDEEILSRHVSTKFRDYNKLYSRILDNEKSLIDLGSGVNGFSYKYLRKKVKYVGVEGVGQIVKLTNNYFKKNKVNGKVIHEDLLNIKKILKIIKETEKPRIVFMFNIIDGLALIDKEKAKEMVRGVVGVVDKVVLSFPVRSLGKRKEFKVKRYWLISFLERFKILDKFEMGGEKFVVLKKK